MSSVRRDWMLAPSQKVWSDIGSKKTSWLRDSAEGDRMEIWWFFQVHRVGVGILNTILYKPLKNKFVGNILWCWWICGREMRLGNIQGLCILKSSSSCGISVSKKPSFVLQAVTNKGWSRFKAYSFRAQNGLEVKKRWIPIKSNSPSKTLPTLFYFDTFP